MNKLTKKHYNRKLFTFGIMLFISIALISTGFAAFVLSTNAKAESGGNIEVGTIDSNTMEIKDVTLSNASFRFDAKSSDNTGRIRGKTGEEEVLSVTVTGKVTNASYLDRLVINLTVPESTVKAAATAGYIILPECAGTDVQITDLTPGAGDVKTFTYTISFKWGEKFDKDNAPDDDPSDNLNPCEFYDLTNSLGGYLVNDETMIATMTDFRTTMYGLNKGAADFNVNAPAPDANLTKFKIELKAYVN